MKHWSFILYVILALMVSSCTAVYDITTPEMYDSHISNVNSEIEKMGYEMVFLKEDTIYRYLHNSNRYVYVRNYVFTDGKDSVDYTIVFNRAIMNMEAFVPYIDNVDVRCSGNEGGCKVAMKLLDIPVEKKRVPTDGTFIGSVLLPPVAVMIAFFSYVSINNTQHR